MTFILQSQLLRLWQMSFHRGATFVACRVKCREGWWDKAHTNSPRWVTKQAIKNERFAVSQAQRCAWSPGWMGVITLLHSTGGSARHWIILSKLCSKISQSMDDSEGGGCVALVFVFPLFCLFVCFGSLFICKGAFCYRKEAFLGRCWWIAVGEDFDFREDGICLGGCHKPAGICKRRLLSPCFFQGLHLQQTARSGPKCLTALFYHF